jgi:hypothetical protein
VLRQLLEQWTNRLRDAQPSAALAEHTVRLLMFAVSLLGQHRVNERGRCQFCRWSRWRWPFWHRRPQNLDVVWWQLLTNLDKKISLVDVREWMTQREQQACSAVLAEHNPAAPRTPPPEQAGPAMTDAPSPSPNLPSSPAPDEPG